MLRKLKENEVDFELIVHNEDIDVRGNAIASDDDEFDKQIEDEIIDRLNRGDIWAWCCVEVKATFGRFSSSDYLGCCCYEDEDDFISGGYYEDMKSQALDELNNELQATYHELKALNA